MNVTAGDRLLRPQSANPGIQTGKGALQRFYLPEVAAELPVFHTVVKEVDAFFVDHSLYFLRIGKIDLDLVFVFFAGSVNQVVCLWKQSSGIEGENSGLWIGSIPCVSEPDPRHPGLMKGQFYFRKG